ncbi:hypothetical protein ACRRTK_008615 [Alexandromys fortis]
MTSTLTKSNLYFQTITAEVRQELNHGGTLLTSCPSWFAQPAYLSVSLYYPGPSSQRWRHSKMSCVPPHIN